MANLIRRERSPMVELQRDIDELMDEFDVPRGLRRQMNQLLAEDMSPGALWREMDAMFDDFVSPPTFRRRITRLFENIPGVRRLVRGGEAFTPQLDLTEQDDSYVMRVDLPGVREQDVDVRISDDNVLTITGQRREEETKRGRGYQYTERAYGSFSRSIALPREIDPSKIAASFHDGVLDVRIPKGQATQTRKIPVGAKEEPRVIAPGNGGQVQVHPS